MFLLAIGIGFVAGRISVKVDGLADVSAIRASGQASNILPTVTLRKIDNNAVTGSYRGDVRIAGSTTTAEQRGGEFSVPLSDIASTAGATAGATALDTNYPYVASKNSEVFHAVSAPVAKRIKPENRVYFASREEAQKKGFRPGTDVK